MRCRARLFSDQAREALDLLFNSEIGLSYLTGRRQIDDTLAGDLKLIGLSGIANLVAAIKVAKRLDLGENDLVITLATDSAALYAANAGNFAPRTTPTVSTK